MSEEVKKELGDYMETFQPIKRTGLPIDIAYAALWLASDESRFVSGHPLVVDGGASVGFTHETIDRLNKDIGEIQRRTR